MKLSGKHTHKARGQATIEWTIATSVLIIALFVPWNGQDSAMSMFMKAVRTNNANSTFVISLP